MSILKGKQTKALKLTEKEIRLVGTKAGDGKWENWRKVVKRY